MNATLRPESVLKKEWRLFQEGFIRLVNAYLNMMFDLSPKASSGRFWAFVILFFLSGFLLSLINYPLTLWLARAQDIFLYFFSSAYRDGYTSGHPISNLVLFAMQVFFDPRNLRFLPLLLAPYFISLQSAAIYLADIFNLEDVSIARRHILEVALGGSDETIHIAKGEIAEDDKKSANYLIGGPGKVIVELDSAALFEKPDGTPHIIGPTSREPGGKATIEAFERFREAIDLRDHFVELRDLDEKARSVHSRSKDGIPIIATDVRFMFSIDRGTAQIPPSDNLPYPFNNRAVERLIYKAFSKVTPEQKDPSAYAFLWRENMTSLIRSELAKFMSRNDLNKYFASIGQPEVNRVAQRENLLTDEARNLLPLGIKPQDKKEPPKKPDFVPRPQIKGDLFSEFVESFNKTARERGVKLQWIGIGTWNSPIEKVFSKHIEAWKISRENAGMDGNDALKGFSINAVLHKMTELIQDIPLRSYQQASQTASRYQDIIQRVIIDYRKQLIQAKDLWAHKGELVPVDVEDAIKILFDIFGHTVGGESAGTSTTQNPPPEYGFDPDQVSPTPNDDLGPDDEDGNSPSPGFSYADLIRLVNGDGVTANRLIEHERANFPNESHENLIVRAIDRLIQDRQR
ncbi:MAG: hypothetical protein AB1607_11585 [Chloroflexota bacterium]